MPERPTLTIVKRPEAQERKASSGESFTRQEKRDIFRGMVIGELEAGFLRYSRRKALLNYAGRLGINEFDAALLIEMGLNEVADFVVVVTADDTIKIKRAANLGISEEEAKSIITRQTPVSEKLKSADYSIDNNSDLNTIKKGVNKLWKKIQEL